MICLFQSHTYSRTHALLDGFAETLSAADKIFIAPIYAARETDTLGVDQYILAERIGAHAEGVADIPSAAQRLAAEAGQGDVAVIMGAGNIDSAFGFLNLK